MLAQLKLAWWRDRLGADSALWPKGEPLLARLAAWSDPSRLIALVDGWEALLAEPPVDGDQFAAGRAAAVEALAGQLGAAREAAGPTARAWAMAELALDQAASLAGTDRQPLPRLPRVLRPLAVLAGTTRRAVARGGGDAVYRPGTFLTAVRIGLLGR